MTIASYVVCLWLTCEKNVPRARRGGDRFGTSMWLGSSCEGIRRGFS